MIINHVFPAETYAARRSKSLRVIAAFAVVLICTVLTALCVNAARTLPEMVKNGGITHTVHSTGYTAVLYNNTNGLPTSEANTVVQSADGFIWIGGYSGLIRYNGNEFYRYPSSSGISNVVCLFIDSRGRLWVGTNDSGAAVMENEEFTFFSKKDGLQSFSIRSITEDREGNILLATTMGAAYIDRDNKLHLIDDQQINKEYIYTLACGSNGVVYGITLSGSVFTLENKRVTAFYSPKDIGLGQINAILPDSEDPEKVYLGNTDGYVIHCKIDQLKTGADDIEVLSTDPHKEINCIRRIGEKLWICADTGIGFFDENNVYNILEDCPMTGPVNAMMSDHEGNLWFNSNRQGLMKIVKNNFIDISNMSGLPDMVVNSTCKSGTDLYIGTDVGLKILDKEYDPIENDLTVLLDGVRIRCIREDMQGYVWLCTYSDFGLVRYDPKTGKIEYFTTANGLLSNRVRMIKQLSDGRIAVATNLGVNIIRGNVVTDSFDASSGISNLEILTIEENEQGGLLLGSDGDGIYVVDNGSAKRMGIDDGLASEVILRIKKDPKENLYWIITSNSIAYMSEGKITTVREFPYANNFDIYFNDKDEAWVLSSNGVYVVKKEELIANKVIDYVLYDNKCGLPCAASPNSRSHFDETNGQLFIAGSSRVVLVNINGDMTNGSNVSLDVSYIYADDTYYDCAPNSFIRIPSDCKRVKIYPNAFTYALNSPRISYYLEGFDDEPVEISREELGTVSYTNLSGGTYRFHLSVIDPVTGATDKSIIVTIIKDRAFYEMTWFWVLAAVLIMLLLIIIIVIYFNSRTKHLLKKEAENKKLINEMTNAFAKCVDSKDAYTNGHSFRVAAYTAMLARRLGKSKDQVESIYRIALLHDIGKISIPDHILNKPGKLDDEEFQIMKSHAKRGYDILKDITIAPELALGAACHHERLDGRGYPAGLKGDEIPEVAQIIAVADTFDAMYSTRPYRKKMELSDAIKEIKKGSGTQFNPKVVGVFLALAREGAFDIEPETPKMITNEAMSPYVGEDEQNSNQ